MITGIKFYTPSVKTVRFGNSQPAELSPLARIISPYLREEVVEDSLRLGSAHSYYYAHPPMRELLQALEGRRSEEIMTALIEATRGKQRGHTFGSVIPYEGISARAFSLAIRHLESPEQAKEFIDAIFEKKGPHKTCLLLDYPKSEHDDAHSRLNFAIRLWHGSPSEPEQQHIEWLQAAIDQHSQ